MCTTFCGQNWRKFISSFQIWKRHEKRLPSPKMEASIWSRARRIRTFKMTESESAALPFGYSPMDLCKRHICRLRIMIIEDDSRFCKSFFQKFSWHAPCPSVKPQSPQRKRADRRHKVPACHTKEKAPEGPQRSLRHAFFTRSSTLQVSAASA